MDNSKAFNHNDIKSSLFPLETKDAFEARLEELSNTKPHKATIFTNQIHYAGESNFIPVVTPLKNEKFYGADSVVKNHFARAISKEYLPVHIGTPTHDMLIKEKARDATEVKPIFESTIKPNYKDKLKQFSPELIKDFDINIGDKKADENTNGSVKVPNKNKNNSAFLVTDLPSATIPINKVGCNCKNSQCLKLYCECFRNQILCKNCSCLNCHNKTSNGTRRSAIHAIKSKNPFAFDPKFKTTKMVSNEDNSEMRSNKLAVIVSRGCKCKHSSCRKKYCECYQYGLSCSDKCNCVGCKNGRIEICGIEASNVDRGKDQHELLKRDEFDVQKELLKKLLEIKKFKLENNHFN